MPRADGCADCGREKPSTRHTYCDECGDRRRRARSGVKAASSTARGYDAAHQQERKRLEPEVNAGRAHCVAVVCLMPNRWIEPGTPWDLGHTPDRTAWTGPEHERCNRSEGATRGNRKRKSKTTPTLTLRDW